MYYDKIVARILLSCSCVETPWWPPRPLISSPSHFQAKRCRIYLPDNIRKQFGWLSRANIPWNAQERPKRQKGKNDAKTTPSCTQPTTSEATRCVFSRFLSFFKWLCLQICVRERFHSKISVGTSSGGWEGTSKPPTQVVGKVKVH